jgi:D-beta-D-heptose 7-phosphate kinase/D-beta-D-heptose 1-phosphate adenosyltransferase
LKKIKRQLIDNKKIVCVSGGFDPIHIGHVRMILDAAKLGHVIVIANSDEWLLRKKGYVFMSYEERQEILYAIKGVVDVVEARDDDNTVCESLRHLNPHIFANGGDRGDRNTPEMDVCKELSIQMVWGMGGNDKPQSSSWLIDAIRNKAESEK